MTNECIYYTINLSVSERSEFLPGYWETSRRFLSLKVGQSGEESATDEQRVVMIAMPGKLSPGLEKISVTVSQDNSQFDYFG